LTIVTLTLVQVMAAVICALGLAYVGLRWWRRGNEGGRRRAHQSPASAAANERAQHGWEWRPDALEPAPHDRSSASNKPSPQALGRLRSGREADRSSEDDLAQQHVGWRGLSGQKPKPIELPEEVTQTPKSLDPGHTA
jgi:hypothetical protein